MKTARKILSVMLVAITLCYTSIMALPVSAVPGIVTLYHIDITVRTDIAGQSYWKYDYKDVYKVDSEYVGYPDESFNMPLRIYNEKGNFADELVAGKKYQIRVYVQADPNCFYAKGLEVYINGEKAEKVENIGDKVLCVDYAYHKITNNRSINIFARFINRLKAFFKSFGANSDAIFENIFA